MSHEHYDAVEESEGVAARLDAELADGRVVPDTLRRTLREAGVLPAVEEPEDEDEEAAPVEAAPAPKKTARPRAAGKGKR